jgi:hypothetical protein
MKPALALATVAITAVISFPRSYAVDETNQLAHAVQVGSKTIAVIPPQSESFVTKSDTAIHDKTTGATTLKGTAAITLKIAGKSAVTINDEELTLVPQRNSDAAFGLEGTWTHNIPWPDDGTERTVILTGSRNGEGKPEFEMEARFFSYKPVFTKYLARDGRVEIHFKMVLKHDQASVSDHTLKYVLNQANGVWSGRFIESWAESHIEVTLKEL